MRRSRSRRSLFTWLVMLASRERTCKDKSQVSLAAETVLSRTAQILVTLIWIQGTIDLL